MAGDEGLIDQIYSVVADPARWPSLLTSVSDQIGSLGGMAAYVNLGRGESMMEIGRLSPVFAKVFEDRHLANPWTKAMQRVIPNRRVVMMSSLVPFSSVSKTPFHADVLAPGAIVDGMSIMLPSLAIDGGYGGLHFSIQRRREKWTSETARQLERLAPHLCRALEACIKLAPLIDGTRQIERVLSLMPSAALLIDGQRRVRFANAAAEQLFVARDGLSLDRERQLQVGNPFPAENAAFSRALTEALDVASGEDRRIGEPVKITRLSGAGSLLVVPVPLPKPVFELWKVVESARALVLVLDPNARQENAIKGLRSAFGLTAAEARVASLVASGLSGPQTANVLGVTAATVKTHLARSFEKTGTRSQVALARLLSGMPVFD
ncbi:helix-turn-helix transcriptional regulator [Bradyrhizobium sp. LHD-71]|uniref:helix-turn-helix transcriptional regulator n=1 Tax=Bradyrhizobium sp. LHD-71 TaxID=3072141 RepID=UPI00280F1DEA|nr:helix-turn-helix transcriptional regulator [Bradyrhizobium sp. LHD-71]MDQ8729277.1 helix-turn-helix transcriptional regulator [Bradyrhizobium sp. LHD-71]